MSDERTPPPETPSPGTKPPSASHSAAAPGAGSPPHSAPPQSTGSPLARQTTSTTTHISSARFFQRDEANPPPPPPKHSLHLWAWEVIGLVIVIVVGILLVGGALLLLEKRQDAIAREKEKAAADRPIPAVNVIALTMNPVTVTDTIRLPGMLLAWEDVKVPAEVGGILVRKTVDGRETPLPDGADVKTGDVMACLDDRDYRLTLERAEAAYKVARTSLERTRQLHDRDIRTAEELDKEQAAYDSAKSSFEQAQLDLERTQIRSPMDGVIETILPSVGEMVPEHTVVANLLQTDPLKLEIGIPERDVNSVRSLEEVDVLVDAIGDGLTVRGLRTWLSEKPPTDKQVYILRLRVANPDGLLRPGMFAEANIVRGVSKDSFLVPIFAVLVQETEHYVYVLAPYQGDGAAPDPRPLARAERRAVRLGVIQGDQVQILDGLKAGDSLIVVGQRGVENGSVVQVLRTVDTIEELRQ